MSNHYKIIKSATIDEISSRVNIEMSENNYTPLGGVQIEVHPLYGPAFYQTLIKYDGPAELTMVDVFKSPECFGLKGDENFLSTTTVTLTADAPPTQKTYKKRKPTNENIPR